MRKFNHKTSISWEIFGSITSIVPVPPVFNDAIDFLSVELKPDGRLWGYQMFSTAFCSVAVSTLFAEPTSEE